MDDDARADALAVMRAAGPRVLVSTDVAARGLDFPDVCHVIMFDIPKDVAGFIHRAGRTARGGADGLVDVLAREDEVRWYLQLRAGEAMPGTPLHRHGGREGVARAGERAAEPKFYGWPTPDPNWLEQLDG